MLVMERRTCQSTFDILIPHYMNICHWCHTSWKLEILQLWFACGFLRTHLWPNNSYKWNKGRFWEKGISGESLWWRGVSRRTVRRETIWRLQGWGQLLWWEGKGGYVRPQCKHPWDESASELDSMPYFSLWVFLLWPHHARSNLVERARWWEGEIGPDLLPPPGCIGCVQPGPAPCFCLYQRSGPPTEHLSRTNGWPGVRPFEHWVAMNAGQQRASGAGVAALQGYDTWIPSTLHRCASILQIVSDQLPHRPCMPWKISRQKSQ